MTAPDAPAVEVGPMPWHPEFGHADCGDDEWAVVEDASGEVVGCHVDRAGAVEQIAALYAEEPVAETLVASADVQTGAMIAWAPSMADADRLAVPGGEMAPQLHLTAIYLGDAAAFTPERQAEIITAAQTLAGQTVRFAGDAFAVAAFNPSGLEPCLTLLVSGSELAAAQAALMADPVLSAAAVADPHEPWIPHVTLGYYDAATSGGPVAISPDIQARTGPILFDRLRVAFAGVTTDIPLLPPPVPEPVIEEIDPAALDEDMVAASMIAPEGTPFRIPLVIREGEWSSSGRMFAEGALSWATPPLSLKAQFAEQDEHKGAVIAGRIDGFERDPDTEEIIGAWGVMDDAGEAGAEALRLGKLGMLNGISLMASDIDNSQVELVWPEAGIVDEGEGVDDAEPIDGEAAFHGHHNQKDHGTSRGQKAKARRERRSGKGGLHSGGAAETEAQRRASVEGAEHFAVEDEMDDGEEMPTGLPPRPREVYHAGRIRSLTIVAEPDFEDAKIIYPGEDEPPAVVVASGATQADGSYTITIPKLWPVSWFEEPTAEEMPPFGAIHITASGRITGWLAPPGVTHRAFRAMNRAVFVPTNIDYSEFNNKPALVAGSDGSPLRIAAGTLTFDCGHAGPYDPRRADPTWAAQHYENSCAVAARVVINRHSSNGVPFVAGGLLHGVDSDTIERMMGCALSGDWQGGKLKAALFVPSEGFPFSVKEASARVRDDQLVASSIPVHFVPSVAQHMESLARRIGMDHESRFAAARARVEGSQ